MKSTTIDGSLFQDKITIFPSKFAMCHAHIRHDPLVSRMETTTRHMYRLNREPSLVTHMQSNQSHICTSRLPLAKG